MTWIQINKQQNRKGRFPFALSLSYLYAMFLMVLLLGIGLDFANIHNGLSYMLISLVFIPTAIFYSMILLRYVRLGTKIIPLTRGLRSATAETGSHIARFSQTGKFLVFFQLCSLITSNVVL